MAVTSLMPNRKADIISQLTLFLDKALTSRCINILRKYLNKFEIENVAIINKLFIFKADFLTMRNITKIIY